MHSDVHHDRQIRDLQSSSLFLSNDLSYWYFSAACIYRKMRTDCRLFFLLRMTPRPSMSLGTTSSVPVNLIIISHNVISHPLPSDAVLIFSMIIHFLSWLKLGRLDLVLQHIPATVSYRLTSHIILTELSIIIVCTFAWITFQGIVNRMICCPKMSKSDKITWAI